MALGKKLKQLLDERNITIKDFAESIGVAPTTLYSFITRDSDTGKLGLIDKICKGLNIEINEFICEKEELKKSIETKTPPKGVDIKFVTIPEWKNFHAYLSRYPGDDYTEEELEEIKKFAEFLKSKRKELPHLEVNAAHAIPGASEEDKQHDEDIMDDENF